MFKENAILTLTGGTAGVLLTVMIMLLFSPLIEQSIGLPFLLPNAVVLCVAGLITVVVTVVAGALTAAVSAYKISKMDTGLILRGDT